METRSYHCWLLTLAAAFLLGGSPARGASRGVHDEAGLLGKAAQEAQEPIDALYRRYGFDLLIETVRSMPADRAAETKHLGRSKFFTLWAEERALAAGVDGVYVLICAAPRHVEIHVTDRFQKTFDKRSVAKLHKVFAGKNDRNLPLAVNEAVKVVQDRLEAAEADTHRAGWGWVVWAILGILGVWLLLVFVRRLSSGGTVVPPSAVSSGALAGQSIYQAMVSKPSPSRSETLPYPSPATVQPQNEGAAGSQNQ